MPRMIVWKCDGCERESRSESWGWLVVKQFDRDRPRFYAFCSWKCLSEWLSRRDANNK